MSNNQGEGPMNSRTTRRAHHKSRTGCLECKRRRIKCDEKKPSCTRCDLSLNSCVYSRLVDESGIRDEEPHLLGARAISLSSETTVYSTTTALTKANSCTVAGEYSLSPSDTALYHHYLQHTSHISTPYEEDKKVFEIIIPTLALQSKLVLHAVLALSAACLCSDMVAKRPLPHVATVNEVLMAGYRHFNAASEMTRDLISHPTHLKPEPLLASAPFLIGFATASQQINHWMRSRKPTAQHHSERLSSSLRDMIIIINGLKATISILVRQYQRSGQEIASDPQLLNEIVSAQQEFNTPSTTLQATLPPSRVHVLYPIIAAKSEEAFSRLQQRLNSTSIAPGDDASFVSCVEAYQRVLTIRNLTFSPTGPSAPLAQNNADTVKELPQWLRAYIGRPEVLLPDKPLIRPYLMFLNGASQQYLDLLLPLLDESLESPIKYKTDGPSELTPVQAIALDIWSHWCILMFLVEEEAWWIGHLPFILLTGMLNRYGEDFVARLWPSTGQGQPVRWWPASMLTCFREVRRCSDTCFA